MHPRNIGFHILNIKNCITQINNYSYKCLQPPPLCKNLSRTFINQSSVAKVGENYQQKKQLPKPPLPKLEDTLKKYVDYAKVISKNDSEWEETKKITQCFRDNEGAQLQEILQEIATVQDNWSSHFWLDDMYLNNRIPLPICSNVAYIFPPENFHSQSDMIRYASLLTCAVFTYKESLDKKSIPIDKATGKNGGQMMCMDQYWQMFTSYREAYIPTDLLHTATNQTLPPGEQHIILLHKSQPYVIKTVINGERLPLTEIEHQFKVVLENSKEAVKPIDVKSCVNVVTASQRDVAAQCLSILLKDHNNKRNYDLIKSSTFILCFDQSFQLPSKNELQNPSTAAAQLLHGQGIAKNSLNRWYEKTNQFIISEDGIVGMNIEHSVADGIVMLSVGEYILQYIEENRHKKQIGTSSLQLKPERLQWNINETHLNDTFQELSEDYEKYSNHLLNFPYKAGARSRNASSDLSEVWSQFIQRMQNQPRCKHTADITANILQEEKKAEFIRAIERQTTVMTENITGYGIDNHINALREIAKGTGLPLPEFFDDKIHKELFRFPLSTSQVPTVYPETFMCYGPVVQDGYGCCYNPRQNSITFAISTFKSCPKTNGAKFSSTLQQTLDDMQTYLNEWF